MNDPCGAGSVHRSHGIMLQDVIPGPGEVVGGTQPETENIPRTLFGFTTARLK